VPLCRAGRAIRAQNGNVVKRVFLWFRSPRGVGVPQPCPSTHPASAEVLFNAG
jgi:hypothetical protein